MKNTSQVYAPTNVSVESTDFFKRFTVLAYGTLAYAVGCTGLFWLILGVGGLAPVGLSEWQAGSIATALLFNTGLIMLFGLQHSIMARGRFKQWLTRVIPAAAERATYMLMSGVVTIVAVYFWQSIPGTIWQVENNVFQVAIYIAYAVGIVYLLLSTLVTNHFELMGLRQVYLYFRGKPYTALPFTKKYMYRYSRHPMMLGMLVLLWATPLMSVTHFVLAGAFTLYIAVGVYFEERDLIKNFGETYHKYKKEIATFIPGMY
ncbi:MAG: NnrU family protein [Gammaproteobacteria bacterium]|nr:NnrU family protein [Gammaproteobacteria bacterium]